MTTITDSRVNAMTREIMGVSNINEMGVIVRCDTSISEGVRWGWKERLQNKVNAMSKHPKPKLIRKRTSQYERSVLASSVCDPLEIDDIIIQP